MSVILTPMVLCFSLPQCSPNILSFIEEHSAYVDGVGAVCDYSLFELEKYGNEEYGTVNEHGDHFNERDRPNNGKMEQSYLSFQHEHPNWIGNQTGRNFINNLQLYKKNKQYERNVMLSSALSQSITMHNSNHFVVDLNHMNQQGISKVNQGESSSILERSETNSINQIPSPNLSSSLSSSSPTTTITSTAINQGPQQNLQIQQLNNNQLYNTQQSFSNSQQLQLQQSQQEPSSNYPLFCQTSQSLMSQSLPKTSSASFMLSGIGSELPLDNIPSVLKSILKKENIDYENDFYWMTRVSNFYTSFFSYDI